MFKNSRTPLRIDRLRTLNEPKKVEVKVGEKDEMAKGPPHTTPVSPLRPIAVSPYTDSILPLIEVTNDDGTKKVLEVLDTWRVDDEWWRKEISRRYYELVLDGGMRLIVYEDVLTGDWFSQK